MSEYSFDQQILMELVKTTSDAETFIWQSENLGNLLYQKNATIDDLLKENFSYDQKQILEELLKKNNIDKSNQKACLDFLSFLSGKIKSLPILSLTLAYHPSQSHLEKIADWFWKNYHEAILLHLRFDESLIAGAIIGYGGRIADFSVIKTIRATG